MGRAEIQEVSAASIVDGKGPEIPVFADVIQEARVNAPAI